MPTPPPSPPGVYGPCVLSNPSVLKTWLIFTSAHEHSAQVNVVCAKAPAHCVLPAVGKITLIGGPPFSQLAGAGPSVAAGLHKPSTQPCPLGQDLLQLPQYRLSLFRSTHELLQIDRPGKQLDEHLPPEQAIVPVHLIPQSPQLFGSLDVGVQVPLHNA